MNAKPFLRRVLVVMLALSLLVPQSLLTVQADTSTISVRDSKVNENPVYSETLRIRIREDLNKNIEKMPAGSLSSGKSSEKNEYCTTKEAVSKRIREYLVRREEGYSIKVRLKIGNVEDSAKEETLTRLMDDLFKAAFEETDKANEGDYLSQILQGYNAAAEGQWEGGTFTGTFAYYTPLFTNAAQEQKLTEKAGQILADLKISETQDEYKKIRLIYDYICQNTVYDFKGMNTNSPYTAFGVLVKGKGVCAGISHAIYYLAKEAGLDCRIINADSVKEGEEGHAWNIVRIGKLYYYLDATWDLDNKKEGRPYQYFLKKTPFIDHGSSIFTVKKDDAFWKSYPLSTKDYPYEDKQPKSESLATPTWPHGTIERKAIRLYWDKDPKAASYEIYRSSDGMDAVKIGASTNGKYTDTKVKSGTYYVYFLKAVSGNKTSGISEGNFFCFLAPPESLKTRSAGGGTVKLYWKKVKGATGYQIRYGTDESFKSARQVTIRNRKTLQKTIKGLKKKNYYFQIRTFKKKGNRYWYSVWSKAKLCRVK